MSDTGFFLLPTNELYKKEDTRKLKIFPVGYVGNFCRNLADSVECSSDFFSRIAADANIPKEDVQKYLFSTSDFAKSIQTDINHYVIRDRIKDASFRQKLAPISKNILRTQNPLELVFEDLSTFDAENPIVGSLLREIGIRKKQSDSDFIKSLPSHPGKEFEIQKKFDRLRGKGKLNFNNDDRGDGGSRPGGGTDLNLGRYGLDKPSPSLPLLDELLDNDNPPPFGPSQPPQPSGTTINLFNSPRPPTALNNLNVVENVPTIPSIYNKGIRNDMSGSQAAMATPSVTKKRPDKEIDDFLYKLSDTGMPDLVLGDGLIQILGTTAKDLFDDNAPPTKKRTGR